MSVDDRVREAFTNDVEKVDVPGSLDAVRRRARAEVRARAATGVAAAATVVIAGGIWLVGGDKPTSSEPVGPVGTPTSSPSSSTAPTRTVEDIDGRWVTDVITAADLTAALAGTPLEEWTDKVLADLPSTPWNLYLAIDDGSWRLWAEHGTTMEIIDEQWMQMDAFTETTLTPMYGKGGSSRLTHSHRTNAQGLQVLRWTVLSTTEPPSHGAPAKAFLKALYEAAPFVEVAQ
jgi:hypothetical protein